MTTAGETFFFGAVAPEKELMFFWLIPPPQAPLRNPNATHWDTYLQNKGGKAEEVLVLKREWINGEGWERGMMGWI